jgi:hypothetical protein
MSGSPAEEIPSTSTWPESGFNTPQMVRRVVDFPAPLAPRRPVMAPSGARNETSRSAVTAPNCFLRLRTSIILTV